MFRKSSDNRNTGSLHPPHRFASRFTSSAARVVSGSLVLSLNSLLQQSSTPVSPLRPPHSQATLPPSPHNRSSTRTTPRTFDPQASVPSPPPRCPGLRGSSSGTHSGTGLVIFHCLELPLTSCAPSELRREPVVHFLFRKSLTSCPRTPYRDLEHPTVLLVTRLPPAYSRVSPRHQTTLSTGPRRVQRPQRHLARFIVHSFRPRPSFGSSRCATLILPIVA